MLTLSISRLYTLYFLTQILSIQITVEETKVSANLSSSPPEIFVEGYSTSKWLWIQTSTKSPPNYARYITRTNDDISVEDSTQVNTLVLGCKAPYPIFWKIMDVRPTTLNGMSISMKVSLQRNRTNLHPHEFISSLILSNNPTLTGSYTCRSIANNGSYLQSSVYVFLTGHSSMSRKLATFHNIGTVGINGHDTVVLPCRVTRKDVELSLFRKENSSWVPMATNVSHISFDPKRGFTLYKNEGANLTGQYKCKVVNSTESVDVNVAEEYHRQPLGFPPNMAVLHGNASVDRVRTVLGGDRIQCCSTESSQNWKPTLLLNLCENEPDCQIKKWVFEEKNVGEKPYGVSSVAVGTRPSCTYALDDVTGKSFLMRCFDGHSVNYSGVLQPIFTTSSHKRFAYSVANRLSYSIDDRMTLKITKHSNKPPLFSFLRPKPAAKACNPQNHLYRGEKYIFECCGLSYDHAVGRIFQIVWEDGNTTQFLTKDEAWDPTRTDYCSVSPGKNENPVVMEFGMKYAECIVPRWYSTVLSIKRVELIVRDKKPPVLSSNVTLVNVTYDENQLGILQLVCDMSQGDPAPTVSWTKDGKKISSTDLYYSVINDPNQDHPKTSLLFMRAVKEIEGNYTCTATNLLGSVSKNFRVTVNPRNYLDYWVSLAVFGGFFVLIAMCAVKITISEKRTSMPSRKQSLIITRM